MERLTHSVKVLWRTERLLLENDLHQGTKKIGFVALAALVGVFGLAMLGVALFFALVPVMGYALAALTVGGVDLVIAAILIAFARSLKPAQEVEMIRQMRDAALDDIEDEVGQMETSLVAVKDDIRKFVRHPIGVIGPLINAIIQGVLMVKK